MSSEVFANYSYPLSADEVINCLRFRWSVAYDLQLVVRDNRLYLQMMWAYLEQQSFPLDEDHFRVHLNEVLEVINRIGKSNEVREWLLNTQDKPRLGRAITLPLTADERLEEFLL